MSSNVVARTMVAVSFLEIAAQGTDAQPIDVGRALERVVSGFRESPSLFSEDQKARAVAAIEAAYVWRGARIAAFLRDMNDAFAEDLESSKDLIMRR